jgi:hypothetical protein
MPSNTTLTFRNQTTGSINDLLEDEGLQCLQSQNLLTYLAGALLNYKEEGVELAPSILFCESVSKVFQAIPGLVRYQIRTVALSADSGSRILKDCAPLTSRNWFIFVERVNGHELAYGVFSYPLLPTTITLSEAISLPEGVFSVLLRKVSSNTVEVAGAKGNKLALVFSTMREQTTAARDPIDAFAGNCCRDVPGEPAVEGFQGYFKRLLEQALTASHGTILACANVADLSGIVQLKDAVLVQPMLDFREAFTEYQQTSSAEAIVKLQSYEDLLFGFLRSDGIVIFDTKGCVMAYRVFFREANDAPASAPNVVGGARRRAFEGVKGLVGSNLVSALFRSQDGLTLHHGQVQ